MFRRALIIMIGAAVAAAFATGCGEDDSVASVPRAQFTKEANAECKRITTRTAGELSAYAEANVKGNSGLSPAQEEELLETMVIPSVNEQIEALEEIGFPEGDEEKIEAMIEELERVVDEAEDDSSGVLKEDSPFAKSEKIANTYGIVWCGHQ